MDIATITQTVASAVTAADADATTAAAVDVTKSAYNGLLAIGKGVAYGASAGGAGAGIGLVVASTISGIARQPEQKGALQTLMFIGIAFIEFFGLVGIAYLFILK